MDTNAFQKDSIALESVASERKPAGKGFHPPRGQGVDNILLPCTENFADLPTVIGLSDVLAAFFYRNISDKTAVSSSQRTQPRHWN